MTSQSGHGLLRALAPFPSDHPPTASQPVPRRAKRSNACTACSARKSKYAGSRTCDECVGTGSSCVFTVTLDRRRKYAQRLAEQKLNTAQQLLDKIIVAFDTGDSGQLRSLLSTAKSLAQGKQLRMLLLKTLRRQDQAIKYCIGSHLARYGPAVSEPPSVLLHPVLDQTRKQPCRTILTSYNRDQKTKEPFQMDDRTPVLVEKMLEFQYPRKDTIGRDTAGAGDAQLDSNAGLGVNRERAEETSMNYTMGERDSNELVAEMDAATNENVMPSPDNAALDIMDEFPPDERRTRIAPGLENLLKMA
ncbi:Pc17g00650 [Penicillium rubens Wisconsin 54-1255]|uniref:Pc17g00650 protein n=1 Tax=Penicillium rubens (strain ATCC 28089 / DSM 1075 / NRRL 1951 / Wisconsin 54-1255) TaxID=500485 RepID=B6HAY8_PENRW|nr:Pc17g00650 [Penicillium rubens Wisconsin 54-1255]